MQGLQCQGRKGGWERLRQAAPTPGARVPFLSQPVGGGALTSSWHFTGDDKTFERNDLGGVFFFPRCPSLSRALGPQRYDYTLDVFFRNLKYIILFYYNILMTDAVVSNSLKGTIFCKIRFH